MVAFAIATAHGVERRPVAPIRTWSQRQTLRCLHWHAVRRAAGSSEWSKTMERGSMVWTFDPARDRVPAYPLDGQSKRPRASDVKSGVALLGLNPMPPS